jgi:hypothetical protein
MSLLMSVGSCLLLPGILFVDVAIILLLVSEGNFNNSGSRLIVICNFKWNFFSGTGVWTQGFALVLSLAVLNSGC